MFSPQSNDIPTTRNIILIGELKETQQRLIDSLRGYEFEFFCYPDIKAFQATEQNQAPSHYQALLIDQTVLQGEQLSLFKQLKQSPLFQHTPCILELQSNQPELMQTGLEIDICFYLIRPYTDGLLQAVLLTATQSFENHMEISRRIANFDSAHPLLQEAVIHVKTIKEAQSAASVLAYMTPDPKKIAVGLFEMMLNAIEHGNLDIGYQRKTELIKQGTLKQEIDHLLAQPEHENKHVKVEFKRNESNIEFIISDQGKGFEYTSYMDYDAERSTDQHGRGIMIANRLSFDSMEYKNNGTTVICRVQL